MRLFFCMVEIGVHVKLDSDLFLNFLQRLINRKGGQNTVVSDCGSNFIGPVKELKL